MKMIKEYEITRIEEDTSRSLRDLVIVEFALRLKVNGRDHIEFLCTPNNLEELVYGHLFAEGIIQTKADLTELKIQGELAEAVVTPQMSNHPAPARIFLQVQDLFRAVQAFNGQSPLFRKTGGVHSCAIYHGGQRQSFMEDIGRHNAVDKALGHALLAGTDLNQAYLITSGRVSGQTMRKALHSGLPIIISQAAPTDRAVQLARQGHLTLCGFARGRRFNIYSAPERIKL